MVTSPSLIGWPRAAATARWARSTVRSSGSSSTKIRCSSGVHERGRLTDCRRPSTKSRQRPLQPRQGKQQRVEVGHALDAEPCLGDAVSEHGTSIAATMLVQLVVRAPQCRERGDRDHEAAARTQHAGGLCEAGRFVVQVLENVQGEHHVDTPRSHGQPLERARNDVAAGGGGDSKGARHRLDARHPGGTPVTWPGETGTRGRAGWRRSRSPPRATMPSDAAPSVRPGPARAGGAPGTTNASSPAPQSSGATPRPRGPPVCDEGGDPSV